MKFEDYLKNLPLLHEWDNKKNTGGFDRATLSELYKIASAPPGGAKILETGAGNSTLTFLYAQPRLLVSICPEASLFERITAFAKTNEIDLTRFEPIVRRSEIALPHYKGLAERFDLVLIDGGHGWPTVFVDFCYSAAMLRKDGLLILDDCKMHSVRELVNLLSEQPGWALEGAVDQRASTLKFRKLTADAFLPDWGYEPYVRRLTEAARTEEARKAGESQRPPAN